jgi:hypothetical protein
LFNNIFISFSLPKILLSDFIATEGNIFWVFFSTSKLSFIDIKKDAQRWLQEKNALHSGDKKKSTSRKSFLWFKEGSNFFLWKNFYIEQYLKRAVRSFSVNICSRVLFERKSFKCNLNQDRSVRHFFPFLS